MTGNEYIIIWIIFGPINVLLDLGLTYYRDGRLRFTSGRYISGLLAFCMGPIGVIAAVLAAPLYYIQKRDGIKF